MSHSWRCQIFFNHNQNSNRSGTGILVNIVDHYRLHLTLIIIIDLLPLFGVHLQLLGVLVVVVLAALLWIPVGVVVTVVDRLPTVLFVVVDEVRFILVRVLGRCLLFLCCFLCFPGGLRPQ